MVLMTSHILVLIQSFDRHWSIITLSFHKLHHIASVYRDWTPSVCVVCSMCKHEIKHVLCICRRYNHVVRIIASSVMSMRWQIVCSITKESVHYFMIESLSFTVLPPGLITYVLPTCMRVHSCRTFCLLPNENKI